MALNKLSMKPQELGPAEIEARGNGQARRAARRRVAYTVAAAALTVVRLAQAIRRPKDSASGN